MLESENVETNVCSCEGMCSNVQRAYRVYEMAEFRAIHSCRERYIDMETSLFNSMTFEPIIEGYSMRTDLRVYGESLPAAIIVYLCSSSLNSMDVGVGVSEHTFDRLSTNFCAPSNTVVSNVVDEACMMIE